MQAARNAAGKTQMEAAVFLGVDKQSLSNWETGRYPADGLHLLRLAVWYDAEESLITLLRSSREAATPEREAQPLPATAIRQVTGGKRRGKSDKKEGGAR